MVLRHENAQQKNCHADQPCNNVSTAPPGIAVTENVADASSQPMPSSRYCGFLDILPWFDHPLLDANLAKLEEEAEAEVKKSATCNAPPPPPPSLVSLVSSSDVPSGGSGKKRKATEISSDAKRFQKDELRNTKKAARRLAWADRYEQLVEFQAEHGHCNVSRNCKKNPALGNWVRKQRTSYQKMCKDQPERVAKLNEIGFKWNLHEAAWNDRYEQLVEFQAEHGHCNVPCSRKDNPALGNWVQKQRTSYQKMCKNQSYRVIKLNELGFKWNHVHEASQYDNVGRSL